MSSRLIERIQNAEENVADWSRLDKPILTYIRSQIKPGFMEQFRKHPMVVNGVFTCSREGRPSFMMTMECMTFNMTNMRNFLSGYLLMKMRIAGIETIEIPNL